ncbi:hypothetical protein KAS50_06915, partial [bacterium]|nr:hypothetical protein [bacterium]
IVAISVINVNRFPVLTATSDTSINEEQHLLLLVSVSDSDNDSVTVTAEELPEGATFVQDNSVYKFDWTPTQMQQGNFDVRFIAVDTLGGADTVITTITVEYVNIAPLLPTIVFPKTGEEIKTSSYFVWERSYDQNPRDTVFYRMEIDDNPDFTLPVLVNEKISPVVTMGKNAGKPGILFKHSKTEDGKSVETVSIRLNEISGYSSLVDDITYFWRVKAFDNGGQSSSFTSGQDSFAVNLANDTPSPISAGISPSGGKTVIDENPEISWYPAFDPDKSDHAGNLRYWIQLSMDSTFAADIFYQDTSDAGINSITVAAALDDEKAWFFRVRTIDDEDAVSDWSEVQKLYVNTKNNPPEPFGLVMPLDQAVFNPMPEGIVLTWQLSSDTDPLSKISYSVEIATDTSFSAASITFSESDLPQDSDSVYIATSTFEADEYYWRIIAKDNDDLITISDEKRSFLLGISTGIDDETETIELPKSYNLYQNYPNPF